jgi:hypothetical protein
VQHATNLNDSALVQELLKRSPIAVKTFTEKATHGRMVTFSHHVNSDAHKVLTDIAATEAQGFFEAYCEKFEGEFKATMKAEFTRGLESRRWWEYETVIEGKLTLRYAKDSRGSAIHVEGEFMGQGTKFKLTYENSMNVFFPKLMGAGSVVRKFVWDPETRPFEWRPEFMGKVVGNLIAPNSFKIPVHGQLVGDTLTLDLDAAITDFDVKTRVVYLIYSPLLAIPIWTAASFPFKDAHFILMRAMGGESAEFEVETEEKEMFFVRDFNNERSGGDMKGTYTLHVKACNPECAAEGPIRSPNSSGGHRQ